MKNIEFEFFMVMAIDIDMAWGKKRILLITQQRQEIKSSSKREKYSGKKDLIALSIKNEKY